LISLGKALSNTRFELATGIVFASALLVWIYYRNLVFPILTVVSFLNDGYSAVMRPICYPLQQYLNGFLVCLICMHFYWTQMMVRMFVKYYRGGGVEDTQHKLRTD